jgi:hypothetical protein
MIRAAIEIVPGALYAVGGGVPPEISVSWIPAGLHGWMPVQCFVFRSGTDAVVMDCGLAAHTAEIEVGLVDVLSGAATPKLLVSRWEPDSMVNLPWLINRFGIREVLSYGGVDPLDFFDRFEIAAAQSQEAAAAGPARLLPVAPGDVIEVGTLRIEVLTASLRLLLTNWYYEHTTRSLFNADSFGFLANAAGPYPFITTPSAGQLSPEALRRSLRTKFDWLAGAYSETLIADLQALHTNFAIDRICPTFGGIIEGRETIDHLFASAISALEGFARETRGSALAGFDWPRALSPQAVIDLQDPSVVPPALARQEAPYRE